jgi:integrase
MSEFYNEVIKNRYLDEMENEGSRSTIKYIFFASKDAEEKLEMDLYNFSKDQIEEYVMTNMTFKSYNTARSNAVYINNYISWAIKHGYRENNLNPLDTVSRKWYSKFIDRTLKIHYSEEEIDDLIEEFENAADQAMVRLWFEAGVQGKDFSEIKHLTYYDIDWINNEIEVKDDKGNKRKVKLSDKCMRYLKNAYHQQTYHFSYIKDGELIESERSLMKGDFIFKNVESPKTIDAQISSSVIYSRIQAIKDKYNLEIFTPVSIKQSGQIYEAYKIFMRDGCFGDNGNYSQWEEIGEKYNTTKVKGNTGEVYYNSSLMKNYITTENLKEFYGVDVPITIRSRK